MENKKFLTKLPQLLFLAVMVFCVMTAFAPKDAMAADGETPLKSEYTHTYYTKPVININAKIIKDNKVIGIYQNSGETADFIEGNISDEAVQAGLQNLLTKTLEPLQVISVDGEKGISYEVGKTSLFFDHFESNNIIDPDGKDLHVREYQIYQVDYDVTVQYDSANATIQYKQDYNYIIFDLVDGKAVLEGDRSELLNDLPFKNNEDRIIFTLSAKYDEESNTTIATADTSKVYNNSLWSSDFILDVTQAIYDSSLMGSEKRLDIFIDGTIYSVMVTVINSASLEQKPLYINCVDNVTYGKTLKLSAKGGSGKGEVTYEVINGTGEATINGNVLNPVQCGTVTVKAHKAGSGDYKEAESEEFTVTINKAKPTGNPRYTPIKADGQTLADANLTSVDAGFTVPGAAYWVGDDGTTVLPDDTVVQVNKYYKWIFVPTDTRNYETATGTVKLYSKSNGGGSSITYYTVSFETNGGSKVAAQRAAKNSVIAEPTAPTKDGYDFAGWYTDKELKNKYSFDTKVSSDMTLYAAWQQKNAADKQIILTIGQKEALVFGKTKANDVAPKIVNERTMLPARFVAESLGASVDWDEAKKLVTVKGKNQNNEDVIILITIGSEKAVINGKEVQLDSPAFVENNRTYTPIRFISESLGADVQWNGAEQKVIITKK